jgi:hypothetical protein
MLYLCQSPQASATALLPCLCLIKMEKTRGFSPLSKH